MKKVKLKILLAKGQEINIEEEPERTVFEILKNRGIEFNTPCGGHGICGKCLIQCFPESSFSKVKEDEFRLLGEEKLREGFRLACQARVLSDCSISFPEVQEYSKIENLKKKEREPVNPLVKRKSLEIKNDLSVDVLDEIVENLGENVEATAIDFPVDIQDIPGKVQIVHSNGKIMKIYSDDGANGIGLAVDVGTTTVVTVLVDLATGKVLDSIAFMNPQRRFGHDVISRINHTCKKKEGLVELHDVIVNDINTALGKMLERGKHNLKQLDQIVIAGNTTMSHIIAKLPVCTIAIAPYRPFSNLTISTNAKRLGFYASEHTGLYIFPSLAAFIGGDIVSGIIATNLLRNKGELFIDLGTNGEMVLNTGEELLCCSTAAGPAFEGANIECGVGNIAGAIEEINFEAGNIKIKTIAQEKTKGICGSGLISLISHLLEKKIINPSGRFYNSDRIPPEYKDRFESPKKRFWLTDSVYISQKDIRNFQLAKSAVRTGIDVLKKNSELDKLKAVRIAGGFGAHLSISALFRTGTLPPDLDCPVILEGNTAISGSVDLLLNQEHLKDIEKIRDSSRYIELSALKEFQELFIENLSFK
ncbi:MAG: DUF4445 domain-containing protein [Kosmotoga sp.]|uniref:ASKHA domain-containing protein n=1 Tax=Kosmotoga sp. TaxID=1955248 RepID=UPI0025BF4323|nr:ASKHA domain-containing protein [Kosmotoga sp.]MCD6160351.1 DUF4445 domain-containing protein [Kosmotoga sp.]